MAELRDLVPSEFKDSLSEAEKLILKNAPTGEWADMQSGDEEFDKPENADKWAESRTVRAKFLEWLLRDKKGRDFIHDKGIIIVGMRIDGELDLYSLTLPFPLAIQHSHFANKVDLRFARIKLIDFSNSHLKDFKADGLVTDLAAFFNSSRSEGEFCLVGANIGGDLVCNGARFINGKGEAFNGDGITTKGDVSLKGIRSLGELRLVGANIGSDLNCSYAKLKNENDKSFVGDRMTTKGTVFLERIESRGDFSLIGSYIGNNIVCTGAIFNNENGDVFSGDRITTKGDVFLNQIESKGGFRLISAHIGGDLYCAGASFENKEKTSLMLTQAQIDGRLCLDRVKKIDGTINMENTKTGALRDNADSWPDQGNLIIDGFDYDSFAEHTPTEIDTRLEWLKLQPQKKYLPQPYQQLAKVYRKMGRDGDAKKVLLAKERMRRKYGKLNLFSKTWSYFLDLTIGYGYRIGRALGIILFFIIYGSVFFHWAYNGKLMQEVTAENTVNLNKEFSPFVYSIDVLVPLLDLNQEKYWRPDPTVPAKSSFLGHRLGWWVQTYFIIHIILGWVFTTLLAASLTGLIRRE